MEHGSVRYFAEICSKAYDRVITITKYKIFKQKI